MSRSKNRVDVVVGVTTDLAEKIENHRKSLETNKGSPVTRTDAIRDLFNVAFEKLGTTAEPAVAKPSTSYSSVPRFSDNDRPIPVSM